MDHPASALARLREATADAHATLERQLHIARPEASRADYLAYLSSLWGWMKPLEQGLWAASWPADIAPEQRRNKCQWIESDLRAAGRSTDEIAAIPLNPDPPSWSLPEQRFGLAYVIEGAQLGTQVLRKRLAPALDAWSPRWLQGYGATTGPYWKTFIAGLDAQVQGEAAREACAAAAQQAFASLTSWFVAQGAASAIQH